MATGTRARMLEAAARLIQLRGYHGTALNDVLAESGAPRGSLYFHFPGGKDQLVLESTHAAVDRVTQHRRDILATASTPEAALRAFAEATAARLRETDYAVSCPIAPIVLDGTAGSPELSDLCRHTFAEWIDLLRAALVTAGIADERARALAMLIQSAFEGALVIARALRDDMPIRIVGEELAVAVESARIRTKKPARAARKPPVGGPHRKSRLTSARNQQNGGDNRAGSRIT